MKETGNTKGRVKLIAVLALFVALSIVLGKILSFKITNDLRFGFENLPIMLASFLFGPWAGAVVALIEDVLGCIIWGLLPINPFITLAAVAIGVISGVLSGIITYKKITYFTVLVPVAAAHVVGSMLIKTVALYFMYGNATVTLLRIPVYVANIIIESAVIYVILQSKAIRSALKGFPRRKHDLLTR